MNSFLTILNDLIKIIKSNNQINDNKKVIFHIIIISAVKFIKSIKSSSSINRRLSSLRKFFSLLIKEKFITENPVNDIEEDNIPERQPKYLTKDESIELLNKIKNNKTNRNQIRDYAIITLFLNCGMRLSELVNINLNKIKNDTLTVIGKGDKERTIYLNDSAMAALNDYLKIRNKIDSNILFLSEQNKPMQVGAVQLVVKKYLKLIGKDEFSTHTLRHTAATLMYKHGNVDIRALQEILGHTNITTTEIYTHVDDEQCRKAVASNPLNSIT